MKTIQSVITGLAAFALSTSLAFAQEFTMRLSHQFPPSHHTAQRLEQFKADVAAETDGRVDVQLFGAAQLYKPSQHHAAVASGEIEAAAIINLQWGNVIPEMSVTLIPYLMSSPASQKAFIGSEAAELLDEKMREKGIRNIAWIVDTNDLIFTSSKGLLQKPDDFKGVKIRGLNKLFDSGLEALGASPVAMPGSEVYQALQTGVLDAGVTGVAAAYARKFYEVQKYGTASAIFLAFDNLVVNPKWWDGLPADVQEGIERAAEKAVQSSLITHEGVLSQDIENLVSSGMEAVVLDDAQIDELKRTMQPAVRKEFLNSVGDEGERLLALIEKM
uniref:TRAP transporter substrate-binding protein DctP n=1 Tax=Marinobacterium profundum TaxID=1714300 RepID=UPI0008323824|nr:TRAP transporter substrate-binding protein DctP [Marinobacterium profundum]